MMGQEQLGRAGRDRLRKSGAIVIPHPSALESSSLGKYETPENVARQTLHHELTHSLREPGTYSKTARLKLSPHDPYPKRLY